MSGEKKVFNEATMAFEEPTPPATEKKDTAKKKDDDDTDNPKDDLTDEEKEKKAKEEQELADKEKADKEKSDKEKKDKKGEDDTDDPEEEIEQSPDDFVKANYGEKYDINSVEELGETLELLDTLHTENEALKEEVKKAKESPAKFESDDEQKAFEFVKKHGVERITDGTYSRLITMDVKATDGRLILEEEYILDHQELTRDEAVRQFSKKYNKDFGPVDKTKFDTDEAAKEEEEDRRIELKSKVEKARKKLEKTQTEFKAKPSDKKEKTEQPEIQEAVQKGIVSHSKEYETHLNKITELNFSPDEEDEEQDFSYKFKPDQLKNIRAVCMNWVKNPKSYNDKGELIGISDPDELFKRAARMVYGDDIEAKLWAHALEVLSIKRAEEIGDHKTTRKGKGAPVSTSVVVSEEEQQAVLIEQKKKSSKKPVMA